MEWLILSAIGLFLIYKFWKMILKWTLILVTIGVFFLIIENNSEYLMSFLK